MSGQPYPSATTLRSITVNGESLYEETERDQEPDAPRPPSHVCIARVERDGHVLELLAARAPEAANRARLDGAVVDLRFANLILLAWSMTKETP